MKHGAGELVSVGLLVLAVVSGLFVYFTRNEPTTREVEGREKHLFAYFREEEVERLELGGRGGGFTVERGAEEGTFVLRTPAVEPADGAAVERLVDGLGFATFLRKVAGDPEAFGVASPRATLTVTMRGQRVRLGVGSEAPAPPGAVYVSVVKEGQAPFVVLVGREVAASLLTTADELRERSLVKVGMNDVAELALERSDTSFRLARGANGSFRLEGGARASRDALEPLFAGLADLRATRFLAAAEAESARGSAPRTVVSLLPRDTKQQPKLAVEIGGGCPGRAGETIVLVRAQNVRAGCVRDEALRPFGVSRDGLADDRPFFAKVDEVETLTLARGGKRLVLTRRGTSFLLREPTSAEVELEAGNARLSAVVRAPAELVRAPDPAKLGFGGDRAVLTVLGRDDRASEETLEIGRVEADGSLPVRRVDDGAVLRLGRDAARAFDVDSTLLRGRRLLDFALSGLVELELDRPERQVLRRAPNGFELVTPSGFQADGELATEVVLALGSLTAARWVADADDGSFGLGTPRATARVKFDAGDAGVAEKTLVIGAPAPGGNYAKLSGEAGVFLLERATVERFETLLVDRASTMGDPASLARVSLVKGERKVVLERRGGELVAAQGSPLAPGLVASALETLGALRAEAALHSGAARPNEGFATPSLELRLEPKSGAGTPRTLRFGAPEVLSGLAVRFARVDGVNATFVVAESKVRALSDLF